MLELRSTPLIPAGVGAAGALTAPKVTLSVGVFPC
jgi:hypothetical protein